MYAVKAIYDGVNFKPMQPVDMEGQNEGVHVLMDYLTNP